jgi:hypothetical protein
VYIDMGVGDGTQVEAQAALLAQRRGWRFEHAAGDLVLIRRLLDGDWETDFAVVAPGHRVMMTHDVDVVGSVPAECIADE